MSHILSPPQTLILCPWSWFSCWVVCIDRVLPLHNKGCNILLENMPCPFPPYQIHISWLYIAPRWVLVPYAKCVFNCLFYDDNPSLFILENTWQVANPFLSLPHFCFTLCFLFQIPNLSAVFAGNIETVKHYFISHTFTVLSY